jgi:hypothetical protein
MVEAAKPGGYPVAAPSRVRVGLVAGTDEVQARWRHRYAPAILLEKGGTKMEALEISTSVLAVLSAALVLVAAGLAKKQLAWKRAKAVPARRHRRRF